MLLDEELAIVQHFSLDQAEIGWIYLYTKYMNYLGSFSLGSVRQGPFVTAIDLCYPIGFVYN